MFVPGNNASDSMLESGVDASRHYQAAIKLEATSADISLNIQSESGPIQGPNIVVADINLSGRVPESTSGLMRSQSSYAEESQITVQTEASESGISNRPAGLFANIEGVQDDVSDWRAAVNKGDFNSDLTKRLITQAFASELEKHLAIQAVALVAGNCDKLSGWHWRVWRKPEEYGYQIMTHDRYPLDLKSELLDNAQCKLVLAMAPVLAACYSERFNLEYVAKKLEVTTSEIEKLRKPMEWNTGFLRDVGIQHFAESISKKNFKIFNLAGLSKEIFYEGPNRAFYIDEAYYRKVPTTHLFHRLSEMILAILHRYYVPLALNPSKHFMPVMDELHQNLGASGFMRLRSRLGSKTKISKVLDRVDLREVRSLYEKTGRINEEQTAKIWDAMFMQLHRLQLTRTLDVIGVFEAILDRDLLLPGSVRHSEIFELSPITKPLIDFVTKLKI